MSAAASTDPLRAMIAGIVREVIAETVPTLIHSAIAAAMRPAPTVPTPDEHKADLLQMACMPSLSIAYTGQNPLGEHPKAVRRKVRRKLPNHLSEEQAERLLAAVASEIAHWRRDAKRTKNRPRKGKLEGALRDEVLVHLGLFLGMRISEWVNLNVEHVDIAAKTLLVFEGKGCKDRLLPIPDNTLPVLANWIGDRKSGPMFPTKRGGRIIDRSHSWRLARLGCICGFTRRLNPHSLRHTAASRMLDRGIDLRTVQEFLGHENMATTSRYLHLAPGRLREAANLASKPKKTEMR